MNYFVWLFALLNSTFNPGGFDRNCAYHELQTVVSKDGLEATQELRICEMNPIVTTGHNEIYLHSKRLPKIPAFLVARFDSLGKAGARMSWSGRILEIHVPPRLNVQVEKFKYMGVVLAVKHDYTDAQFLEDNGVPVRQLH